MPAGLEITNDNNVIQINGQYPCLALRHRGTAMPDTLHSVSAQSSNGDDLYYADITVAAESPIIAIYGPDHYGVIATVKNGSNWTFRVGMVPDDSGIQQAPFTWFVFDKPQAKVHGEGLEVYDESGNGTVVFASHEQPFEVHSVMFERSVTGGGFDDLLLPADRKYATCFNGVIDLWWETEPYTNGQIVTQWAYDFECAQAGLAPDASDPTKKRITVTKRTIAAGADPGPYFIGITPGDDLAGFGGANNTVLVLDVTDYL